MNDIINGHHSEESRSFGSDPHSDQCIFIHVVIMDCVLLVGAKVLSPPYQIQHCFECIFKLFLKTVFNLFCEIGLNRVKSVFLMYFSTAFKGVLTCLKRY